MLLRSTRISQNGMCPTWGKCHTVRFNSLSSTPSLNLFSFSSSFFLFDFLISFFLRSQNLNILLHSLTFVRLTWLLLSFYLESLQCLCMRLSSIRISQNGTWPTRIRQPVRFNLHLLQPLFFFSFILFFSLTSFPFSLNKQNYLPATILLFCSLLFSFLLKSVWLCLQI